MFFPVIQDGVCTLLAKKYFGNSEDQVVIDTISSYHSYSLTVYIVSPMVDVSVISHIKRKEEEAALRGSCQKQFNSAALKKKKKAERNFLFKRYILIPTAEFCASPDASSLHHQTPPFKLFCFGPSFDLILKKLLLR